MSTKATLEPNVHRGVIQSKKNSQRLYLSNEITGRKRSPMDRDSDSFAENILDLNLDDLDQWETELDEFAAGIMRRLAEIEGSFVHPNHFPQLGDQERRATD